MLELPAEWQVSGVELVVADLLRQADAIGQYLEAARAMVRASLEFMLSGPRWTARPRRTRLVSHPKGWRIDDWLFYVLPRADDNALFELESLRRTRWNVDLIAPPSARRLVRYGVAAVLPRFHVDVYAIDSYVGLRLLWTCLDMDMRHAEALNNFLGRYARLTKGTPAIGIHSIGLPPGDAARKRAG